MSYIILKYDDLNIENLTAFQKAWCQCKSYKAVPSFGLIGDSLLEPGEDYLNALKKMISDGVEIWNHGYFHGENEFSTRSYLEQKESVESTQFLMKKHLGKAAATFGAPHNNSTEKTVSVLHDNFPEIHNYLYMADGESRTKARQLIVRCNYESKPGVIDLDLFSKEYGRIKDYPYFVMQGHPGIWTEDDFKKHEIILKRIVDDRHVIVTPEKLLRIELPVFTVERAALWDDELSDFFVSHKTVVCYGAGEIGREVYRYLHSRNLQPDAFVVSAGNRMEAEVCHVPVFELSELNQRFPDCGVILTLLGRLHGEILSQPELSGPDIWRADSTLDYERFIDHVRYDISR